MQVNQQMYVILNAIYRIQYRIMVVNNASDVTI